MRRLSPSLSFSLAMALVGCSSAAPDASAESAASTGAPDAALFDFPNTACPGPSLGKADALALVGAPDETPKILGHLTMYRRQRDCDESTGECGPWKAPTVVPGPYTTELFAYPRWGAVPPQYDVAFESSSSETAIACSSVGEGPCASDGRSVVGVVAAHCVWLLQEAPIPANGRTQWVVSGAY